jgi:LPS export ABC transporter protein LptC
MRRRLQILVLASVVFLLGTVGLLVGRSLWRQRTRNLLQFGLDIVPGVSQHIRDFRRVKVQDGRTVWEVAAHDAQYFDESKTVEVREVALQWYLADGRVVGLKSDNGTIRLDGRDVNRIELNGDIVVSLADYEVRVMTAIYEHEGDRILAPGPVEIIGQALRLRGTGIQVDIREQRLSLLHDVSMQLEPSRLPKGGEHGPL